MSPGTVHVVVPEGIDDPARPSGGNVYDRRVCCGLGDQGWSVVEHPASDSESLAAVLGSLPGGAVVLIDGLVGSTAPQALLPEAARLRLVMLVHMLVDDERECAVLSAMSAVVTTSEWSRDRSEQRYRLPPERLHVAVPGVDEADLSPGTESGGELLCVAAVIPPKGYDVLLAALTEVADRPWRLTCVGSLTRDPEHVDLLRLQARDAGIEDRVCFTGPLTGAALAERYAAADALVLASRQESYGMVVTEALARGLPVIATDVGGLPEALGGSVEGGQRRRPGEARRPDVAGRGAPGLARRRRPARAAPGGRRGAARGAVPLDGHRGPGRPGADGGRAVTGSLWRWVRPLGGAAILGVLVWRLGSGPFLDGVRMVDTRSLVAATVITALTTVCCAWRWSIITRGLGVPVPMRAAVPAYYRSLFLNTTLPGGVLGDVARGVRHGRGVGSTGAGVRAVVWERVAGQVVQVALALAVLLLVPSPWRPSLLVAALVVGGVAVGGVLVVRAVRGEGATLWAWCCIVLASAVAVTGHAVTFLVAARTAGSDASLAQLVPLALLVLLAMSVPTNIAGWGPREGVAAWAFAVTGLGAAQGIAVAVVYGVMGLVASLPGAVIEGAARG